MSGTTTAKGSCPSMGSEASSQTRQFYRKAVDMRTCVNYTTTAVHVVETEQDLLRNLPDKGHGHTLVLMAFDQPQQILAEHLEDHADMRAVGALVPEVVKE